MSKAQHEAAAHALESTVSELPHLSAEKSSHSYASKQSNETVVPVTASQP